MQIQQALPIKKYADALKHAQTPEWRAKRDTAIANIRAWVRDPRVNRSYAPSAWSGYGKDGMALNILMKMAGVDFTLLTIENWGDLPIHRLIYSEFDRFIGDQRRIVFETEKPYVQYIYDLKQWGRKNQMTKKDSDELIDYWDLGELRTTLDWYVNEQFNWQYGDRQPDVLGFYGHRAAESMDRTFLFKRLGPMFQDKIDMGKDGYLTYMSAYPMHNWRDIDVWALLATENCPVSAVYSFHDIPQKGGKQAFPRTYWYSDPIIMNAPYYKWLARYAPVQLQELNEMFPELPAKMRSQVNAAS